MANEKRYKIGIIGAGMIAETRTVPAIINTNLFDIISVYDIDPARSALFCKNFSIPVASTLDGFYANDLDAVYIATPNYAHVPLAIQAMEHNVAVLLEKPCADTYEAAEKLLEASRNAKKPVLLGYMHMWNHHNNKAEQLVKEKKIGDLLSYTATFGFYNDDFEGWRLRRDKSGCGALADLGIYAISTAMNLFGEMPISCSAQASPAGDPELTDKFLSGKLNFSGGRWMHITTSFLSDSCSYAVIGTKGAINVEGSWAQSGEGEIVLNTGEKVEKFTEYVVNPYEEEIKCLKRCLDGEPVPDVIGVKRAVNDVRIMSALDKSAALGGQEVTFDV